MTMRLTLTLPASAAELRDYLNACDNIGIGTIDLGLAYGDESVLTATLGQVAAEAAAPVEPPAPAAPKRAKAKPLAKRPSGPDARTAALAYIEANGGQFKGGAAALAREIGHGEQATTKVVQRLASEGILIVDKASKTSTRSISLASARPTPGNVTALPQPAPPRQPAAPATPPIDGLTAPAGGWA